MALPSRLTRTTLRLASATIGLLLLGATSTQAERPLAARDAEAQSPSVLRADPDTRSEWPTFLRSSSGTTWVRVHPPGESPCPPTSVTGSSPTQTVEHVWCFEGAAGDSTWPANPASSTWSHWSKFAPPNPPAPKWRVATNHGGASTGSYNAWCGCDIATCPEVSYWIFQEGYGDDWNYALELNLSDLSTSAGGTLTLDMRYDSECNYDYMYLEYKSNTQTTWKLMGSTLNAQNATFNGVSGNADSTTGGTGRPCGSDLFDHSDEKDLGGGNEPYYGNSVWLVNKIFPLPPQAGLRLRARGSSDVAWSDQDGRGDTDGLCAIDNVRVDLAFNGAGIDFQDNFETGAFGSRWTPGSLEGNTYDGWHLAFDPMYKNEVNTCTFDDDWMWSARPTGGFPQAANGFDFFLVSPAIDVRGWTGALVEYSIYQCLESEREDYLATNVRTYDSSAGWSPWNSSDPGIIDDTCNFWNMNDGWNLSSYLGPAIDSLQVSWELLDVSQPGEFSWGKHGNVNVFVDNVSFGFVDVQGTQFTTRVIDIFADTFSLSDPAHTPFLQNAEQGDWVGAGGSRSFANSDSLSVEVTDVNGVTEGNVVLWWRHDDGGSGSFTAWASKPMDLAIPDPTSTSDEGTYRQILGKDDGSSEDAEGTSGNGRIWKAGTTVEYYVTAEDDLGNEETFPSDLMTKNSPFEYEVFPLGHVTPNGNRILLVNDYARPYLDFENSIGFVFGGGAGAGTFMEPVTIQPDAKVLDALALIYGVSEGLEIVDRYDVQGGGSSVQCEPRGFADPDRGLGGYMHASGAPLYDALIWLNGTFDEYSYADTTRLELGAYIGNGGNLVSSGDQIAFHLGSGGNNADSTIGFLATYLGIEFPSATDELTDNRVLNLAGEPLTPLAGFELGLYGECPTIRRTFDRLTELDPAAPNSTNRVLMRYTDGGAGDNGRPAVIQNDRAGGGTAVHDGFGIEVLLSRGAIACYLDAVLHNVFGLNDPGYACDPTDMLNGTAAPEAPTGATGFRLAVGNPNPFASTTSIRFALPKRTRATIEIFDVVGRKVRTLIDEVLEPNAYERSWDGRSDSKAEVASGIYFVKMAADDFHATRKITVLR